MTFSTNYKGIVFGKVRVIEDTVFDVVFVEKEDSKLEIEKLSTCIEVVNKELLDIKAHSLDKEIIDAHIEILNDPVCMSDVKALIVNKKYNVEYAYYTVMSHFIETMKNVEDEYIKERYIDLLDVRNRVIRSFLNIDTIDISNKIVYKDLVLPSDVMLYQNCIALISKNGTLYSHTAIMASSMNIPFVLVDEEPQEFVIIDALHHKLIQNPTEDTIKQYQEMQFKYEEKMRRYQNIHLEKIGLYANGPVNDYHLIEQYHMDGIGLLRTEFLFKNEYLNEEKQMQVYQGIVNQMNGKRVTFRTLDLGGDKLPSMYHFDFISRYRGLKLSLDERFEFEKQLRALLQLKGKNIRVIFPLVNTKEELLEALDIVDKCKNDLYSENLEVNKSIVFGSMIETVMSFHQIEPILELSGFVSIGSNDLLSDFFGMDRFTDEIKNKQYNPEFIQLLYAIIQRAKEYNKEVSLCGEIASEAQMAYLLYLMGIDAISLNLSHVLRVKEFLLNHDRNILNQIMKSVDNKEVKEIINKELR